MSGHAGVPFNILLRAGICVRCGLPVTLDSTGVFRHNGRPDLDAEPPVFADGIDAYAGGDRRFADWLRIADRELTRQTGAGVLDSPDQPWRDYFDAGYQAADAATEIAEDGGAE